MTTSPYLNTTEAGAYIRRSPDYVARMCKSGAIKAQKVGEWRIHRDALDQFMAGEVKAPATRKRRRAA